MELATRAWGWVRGSTIRRRWRLEREVIENDPFGKTLPTWARHLMIAGFCEQGWSANDQRQRGKIVATGAWGDELFLLRNGGISCTSALTSKTDHDPR